MNQPTAWHDRVSLEGQPTMYLCKFHSNMLQHLIQVGRAVYILPDNLCDHLIHRICLGLYQISSDQYVGVCPTCVPAHQCWWPWPDNTAQSHWRGRQMHSNSLLTGPLAKACPKYCEFQTSTLPALPPHSTFPILMTSSLSGSCLLPVQQCWCTQIWTIEDARHSLRSAIFTKPLLRALQNWRVWDEA